MNLLFLFLIPSAFIYYLAGRQEYSLSENLLAYMSGIVAGFCAIVLGKLLLWIIPSNSSSFFLHFLSIFLTETGIPVVAGLTALFFILESPIKQRISNIRPQLFGITTIYFPYIFLTTYNFSDAWAVLFLPIMTLSLLFLTDFIIERFLKTYSGSFDTIDLLIAFGPVLAAYILADFCKALWFFSFSPWLFVLLSFGIILLPYFFRLDKYRDSWF